MADVSGIILAGGRSRRLGRDKRDVIVGGVALLDRAVALCAPLVDGLLIVAREAGPPRRGVPVVADEISDRGPMAGVLTGLRRSRHPRMLVIPVDMPLLTAEFLRFLIRIAPEAEITVPRWERGIEPLVAVYTRSCLGPLADALARGATALHAFIQSAGRSVRFVDASEIAPFGRPERLFFNINTAEEVAAAEAMLAEEIRPSRSAPP
ncbi:MAG: molybdenum cofactor guanylyltransferase [Armatimonadota bacterium]|nr:molybdenum cofactor guanylyltransferase [Armatimonadota bacterium]MDR7466283.1 molybdenum cofactor guanylyltransferase [Armatimonadota bacterium]MDR7493004.1 molybdenum cofactor guanylyltransferase [Armatimonadota bacterium]MDR7503704.1 molybdenum cofactor guanylyltransferase [Armatimonadota bacterium]MDR7545956.1 molybdenum cofactor guanylyltransferase [Armatimonadota bacterium]